MSATPIDLEYVRLRAHKAWLSRIVIRYGDYGETPCQVIWQNWKDPFTTGYEMGYKDALSVDNRG